MHGSRGRRRRLAKTRRAQLTRPFTSPSKDNVKDLSQLSLAELSQRLSALQSDKKRNGQRRQK